MGGTLVCDGGVAGYTSSLFMSAVLGMCACSIEFCQLVWLRDAVKYSLGLCGHLALRPSR